MTLSLRARIMKLKKLLFNSFAIAAAMMIWSQVTVAIPFEQRDSTAKCYAVLKGVPQKSEACSLKFFNLNDSIATAVLKYKNQIFRMSSQTVCDGPAIYTCYVENETLEFGRIGKTDKSEYLKLKDEAGTTYYRNQSKKKALTGELFKPISDTWSTCMKSKSHDICIQSKISIEKIPKLRNDGF